MSYSRAVGCLVGLAIGDALGMPTEFLSYEEFRQYFPKGIKRFENPTSGYPTSHLKAGQWTDDTQQAILLAETLIENKGYDPSKFADKLKEWGRKCDEEPGYDRGAGPTSMRACKNLRAGRSWKESGSIESATCGSAMRVAPLGVYYAHLVDTVELPHAATYSSIPTHRHVAAQEAAVYVAALVANLYNGYVHGKEVPIIAVNRSLKATLLESNSVGREEGWLLNGIRDAVRLRKEEPKVVMKAIGTDMMVYKTVPFAVYCFLHSPNDFEKTVLTAANAVPGDTDSIGAIAGAFSGTYNRIEGIPEKLKNDLEDYSHLKDLAAQLVRF